MHLTLHQFRNFNEKNFIFSSPQLVMGSNGSGKTSLLEAISLLATGKSFRATHLSKLVNEDASGFILNIKIPENDLVHSFGCSWQEAKGFSLSLNGETKVKQVDIARLLPTVLFNQQGFELIEGAAPERRKFFDWMMFHVEHSFFEVWRQYQRVLLQRNAAIKQGQLVSLWDAAFVESALQLAALREQVFLSWKPIFNSILAELAQFKVNVSLHQGWDASMSLQDALMQRQFLDQKRGYTSVGPHRADLVLRVDGEEARYRLSRGQIKRLYFVLQIARAELFEQHTQRAPIWLVDDLASELDDAGQGDLVNHLLTRHGTFIVTALDRRLQDNHPFNSIIELKT